MSSTFTLSPTVYELVSREARRARETPDAFAESVLHRALSESAEDEWQQAFEALISRVHARTSRFDSEEIEADITAASLEVKERRRAGRG